MRTTPLSGKKLDAKIELFRNFEALSVNSQPTMSEKMQVRAILQLIPKTRKEIRRRINKYLRKWDRGPRYARASSILTKYHKSV